MDDVTTDLALEADIMRTTSVMDICWPHISDMDPLVKENWQIVISGLKENVIFMQLMNLINTWKTILFSMFMSLILSIGYIYFLSVMGEYVAWGLVFLVQIGLMGMSIGSFYYYTQGSDNNKTGLAVFVGMLSGLISIVFCILVYCGWDQLKLSIEIINSSADFLAHTKRLLVVPVAYYTVLFFFFIFWLACMISVESMGKITPKPKDEITYVPLLKEVTWEDRRALGKTVNLMLGFLIFGLIWFSFFLTYSSNYITMVTASTFYFDSSKEHYGTGSISTGFRWAWVHNFGSLAFGSLIITIIFVIRMMTYYACKKAEKLSGDNPVVKAATCMA